MKARPLWNQVLIEREVLDDVRGGIEIPDWVKDKEVSSKGTVVAVGPGRVTPDGERIEMSVQVGDRICTTKFAGVDVEIDGESFQSVAETDVLCILEDE